MRGRAQDRPSHSAGQPDVEGSAPARVADAPSAFASTYEREVQFTDADWQERATQWGTGNAIGYIARDTGTACGIVGAFRDPADAVLAQLVSMWVAPDWRRCGVGEALVQAIFDWARGHGMREMQLLVTSNNDAAIAFYRKLGFELTGERKPYVNDPTLSDYRMARRLGD